MRAWPATIKWLSPNCFVQLNEIQGAGAGGDDRIDALVKATQPLLDSLAFPAG